MSREYTKILIESLDNGTISHEDVARNFLTFLSEDIIEKFVESDYYFLIEEEDDDCLDWEWSCCLEYMDII